jgi:hypothetical protein
MGAKSEAVTAYPSGAPEFTPGFSGVRTTPSLIFYVVFCRWLFIRQHNGQKNKQHNGQKNRQHNGQKNTTQWPKEQTTQWSKEQTTQ